MRKLGGKLGGIRRTSLRGLRGLRRVRLPPYAKYLVKRAVVLGITLVVAVYLTIVIANMGGYIDELMKRQIEFTVKQQLMRNPEFQRLMHEDPEAAERRLQIEIQREIVARGLNTPFIQRSLIYLRDALTLDLGRSMWIRSTTGTQRVKVIILERLPKTVLLFTTGTVVSAAIGIYIGLHMGRKALSKFDRGMSMFAIITQSIPPWYFGILALLIFAYRLGWFPPGGFVSRWVGVPWHIRILDILHHLVLPLACWTLSSFGSWAYLTRNMVIHILGEDFVMAARAKGVPRDTLLRRYVLRPAAPPIITMIALALIASWTGAIITETVFQWKGLGMLYWEAMGGEQIDAPVVIGLTVIYAYLLVITVFILDIIYGILDPRIRAGGGA